MIKSFKRIAEDLLYFLKHPTEKAYTDQSIKEKAKKFLTILLIDIVIVGVLMVLASLLEEWGFINSQEHKLMELLRDSSIWVFLLNVILIAPLFEELIFRGYLRYKNNYLLRFLIFLVGITGESNRLKVEDFVKKGWHKHYKIVLYFSALLFASIHIFNFENFSEMILFIPILIAPQFVMGLLLAYLRTRHTVKLGILLHFTHNSIAIAITLLTIAGSVEKINIDTKDYSLELSEINIKGSNTNIDYMGDSIVYKSVKMKTVLEYLLDKNNKLIKTNDASLLANRIDLKYVNKIGNSSNNKENILSELKKQYNFKIEKEKILKTVWNMEIADSSLLMTHICKTDSRSFANNTLGYLELKNSNLNKLVCLLNNKYSRIIIDKSGLTENFDIKFSLDSFDKIKNYLKNKFGLALNKEEKEMECINIIVLDKKDKDKTTK